MSSPESKTAATIGRVNRRELALLTLGVAIPWMPILCYRAAKAAAWEPSVNSVSPNWQVAALIGMVAVAAALVVVPRMRTIALGVGIGSYSVVIFGAAALRG